MGGNAVLYLLSYSFLGKFISIKAAVKFQTKSYNHLFPPLLPSIKSYGMREKIIACQNVQEIGWGKDSDMQAAIPSRCFAQTWDPSWQKERSHSLPHAWSSLCKTRFMVLLPVPLTR